MTGPATYTALREHQQTVTDLLADPDITGDLLLVGLWLARATLLRQPEPTSESGDGWQLSDIAADLYPLRSSRSMYGLGPDTPPTTGPDVWKVAATLKDDIRRYDWRNDQPAWNGRVVPCAGPMVRRAVCGKSATVWGLLTDPGSGRRRILGACRAHHGWWQQQTADNRTACNAVTVPRPPANAGGRLARHIRLDWEAMWRGLDPEWVAPPEMDTWARPKLTVLVGDLGARPRTDGLSAAPQPRFALIGGGVQS